MATSSLHGDSAQVTGAPFTMFAAGLEAEDLQLSASELAAMLNMFSQNSELGERLQLSLRACGKLADGLAADCAEVAERCFAQSRVDKAEAGNVFDLR